MRKIISQGKSPSGTFCSTRIGKKIIQLAKTGALLNLGSYFSVTAESGQSVRRYSDKVEALLEKLKIERLLNLANIYSKKTEFMTGDRVSSKVFPHLDGIFCGGLYPRLFKIDIEISNICKSFDIPYIGLNRDSETMKGCIKHDLTLPCWPQDYLEFGAYINMPWMHNECLKDERLIHHFIRKLRIKRNKFLYQTGGEFTALGSVFENEDARAGVILGDTLGLPVRLMSTYSEGGNAFVGERKNGSRFVIVGQDSFDISKCSIEFDLAYVLESKHISLSDEELHQYFKLDYGVDEVIVIEQPGEFHLDMAMTLMSEDTIILNDAVAALDQYYLFLKQHRQSTWEKELKNAEQQLKQFSSMTGYSKAKYDKAVSNAANYKKKLDTLNSAEIKEKRYKIARSRAKFELFVKKQLIKENFNVIQVPGVFKSLDEKDHMNFFNMIQATVNGHEKLIIAPGFEHPYFETLFKRIFSEKLKIKIDHFRILSYEESQKILSLDGGPSCRTKGIGQLPPAAVPKKTKNHSKKRKPVLKNTHQKPLKTKKRKQVTRPDNQSN